MQEKLMDEAKQAREFSKQQDEQAQSYMHKGALRTIQKYLLHGALILFSLGVGLAVILSPNFQQRFVDYIKEHSNTIIIYVLASFSILILILNELYQIDTKLTAKQKKWINFSEDIIRSVVYALLLVILSRFIINNHGQIVLVISFAILIASGVLFFLFRFLKWVYFICGKGKDNLKPWEKEAPQCFTEAQKKEIQKQVNAIIDKKNASKPKNQ